MPASPLDTPTSDRLLDLVHAMADRPVAVLADLVVDRFVSGTPKRISREAPVLILRYDDERFTPGGGANAVANIAALGGRPIPLGVVGDDASGRELVGDLADRGIDVDGILVRPGYRTPTKTRILGGAKGTIKQQIVRLDVDEPLVLDDGERDRLRNRLAELRADPVLVLSDYGYGTVDPELVADLRRRLPDASILCDSRFRLSELAARARGEGAGAEPARGLDGATPNEEEAEALHGGELEPLEAAGAVLLARLGLSFLLVTRGSRGLSLFLPDGSVHLPVHGSAQVADVTGAGDTVIGTFALALAAGGSPVEAAALANYAGGIVVMKMGTATLGPDELAAAVRSDPRPLEELRWAVS